MESKNPVDPEWEYRIRAVKKVGSEDAVETLETLVQGKRLKDISDLPLDLSV